MKLQLLCWIFVLYFQESVDASYDGEYRSLKDYPFLAQIYRRSHSAGLVISCSASILSEQWIITAAHCFNYLQGSEVQVRVGTSLAGLRGKLIDVEKVVIHGDYNPGFKNDNDIALLKLKNPIELNEHQQPIRINKAQPKVGENITFFGFGKHNHGLEGISLRSAETFIIKDETCSKLFKEYKRTRNFFCTSTEYMNLGHGDSGGPAVHDNKLIGLISQGGTTIPSIIVKVANYYDWILQETGIEYLD